MDEMKNYSETAFTSKKFWIEALTEGINPMHMEKKSLNIEKNKLFQHLRESFSDHQNSEPTLRTIYFEANFLLQM